MVEYIKHRSEEKKPIQLLEIEMHLDGQLGHIFYASLTSSKGVKKNIHQMECLVIETKWSGS